MSKEKTENSEIEWSIDEEILLFNLVCCYKPAGKEKNKNITLIVENLNKKFGKEKKKFTQLIVWNKLRDFFNLEKIELRETIYEKEDESFLLSLKQQENKYKKTNPNHKLNLEKNFKSSSKNRNKKIGRFNYNENFILKKNKTQNDNKKNEKESNKLNIKIQITDKDDDIKFTRNQSKDLRIKTQGENGQNLSNKLKTIFKKEDLNKKKIIIQKKKNTISNSMNNKKTIKSTKPKISNFDTSILNHKRTFNTKEVVEPNKSNSDVYKVKRKTRSESILENLKKASETNQKETKNKNNNSFKLLEKNESTELNNEKHQIKSDQLIINRTGTFRRSTRKKVISI